MFKKVLLAGLILLAPCAYAQEAFWAFDDDDKELIIPPECDEVFEADELYEIGVRLLEETGYARQGAAYCLLAAALAPDGHAKAQYKVAEMYHKGLALPKSDLAAYRWATLAALNGSEEADHLGASIEQFLSIDDIQASTDSLASMLDVVKGQWQTKVLKVEEELNNRLAYRNELRERKKERDRRNRRRKKKANMAQPVEVADETKTEAIPDTPSGGVEKGQAMFSQEDLDNVPMPSS